MAYKNTFRRCEMKFPLTAEQYAAVRGAAAGMLTEDSYGLQSICNIYFDNENDELIRTSLDKPVYKEKLRLRTYGVPRGDSAAFVEIKKKFMGVVYKRREELAYAQAYSFLVNGGEPPLHTQQLDEIAYMRDSRRLAPRIVICYDRRAFYGAQDREFRVSFDSRIRYRRTALDLRAGDGGALLEGQPFCVMEIKAAGAMPLWAAHMLSGLGIYQRPFSKYGSIYAAEHNTNDRTGAEQCSEVS